MRPLLSVKDLTTLFQIQGKIVPVIENVSFNLFSGKTLAIVGESGSGKSMTALSLLRILPTPPALGSKGEILFKEKNLLTLTESEMRAIRGQHIGMIFQDPKSALNPFYTIGAQLKESLQAHAEWDEAAAETKVREMLQEVHLPATDRIMNAYPHQISGGMAQRAMIAMALISNPSLLIADEPTTALDVTIQAEILTLLKTLQKKKGMALLLITHDIGVVKHIADEVIVMYGGQIVEKGEKEDLFKNEAHPYTQGLLASRPSKKGNSLVTIPGYPPGLTTRPEGCCFHPRCKWKMDLCEAGHVPLFPLPEQNHLARCWLYDKELEWKLD